jgi:hypothetical protein
MPDGTFAVADASENLRIVQDGFKSAAEAEKIIGDFYLARGIIRPRKQKQHFLTDLAFKIVRLHKPCKIIANQRPIRGIRSAEYCTMIRASIWTSWTIALAAVLAVIATGISTQWQREHGTSQLRELPSFERGLGTHSRLASAQVAAP